ncbi:MAG: type I methionyl aminopeptidase [Bdellovibrionales bacterium]|nr:type I methionyl aminopeptidase [Bdellovibrionales bacterium]
MIILKTDRELEYMRKAGRAVAQILHEMIQRVAPGVSTGELDRFAELRCKELGVIPVFKGYQGFPASVCISVNDEVVHGIPSNKRILKKGDIVGIDFGVSYEGWYGDSARTVAVGQVSSEAEKLMKVTLESLLKGIDQCRDGNRVFDIGHAVQNHAEAQGFSVVREFVGHGIGRALHEDPQVPNYGPKGKGPQLKAGMVLAIEPMINAGKAGVRVLSDGWTAVTADRSLSAHFEHTVAILPTGPEILTAWPAD